MAEESRTLNDSLQKKRRPSHTYMIVVLCKRLFSYDTSSRQWYSIMIMSLLCMCPFCNERYAIVTIACKYIIQIV